MHESQVVNFGIFDIVECTCGTKEFALKNAVIREGVQGSPIDTILCKRFCGYKQCFIAEGKTTPETCKECRSQEIASGKILCSCGRSWEITDGVPRFSLKGTTPFDQDGLRVVEIDWRTDPRWRDFVRLHPQATIYHRPEWLYALSIEYQQRFLTVVHQRVGPAIPGAANRSH